MRVLLLIILLLPVHLGAVQVLDTPVPMCVAVESNGDVTITWQQVPDPFGIFDHYNVYSVPSGALLGSVSGVSNTSITVSPGNAQTASYSFQVQAMCDGSGPFDSGLSATITSIWLNVSNPANGTAVLVWNAPFSVPPAGSNSFYQIYKEFPMGTWNMVGTVPFGTNVFTDTMYTCLDSLTYRVELANSSGCVSVSSVDGDVFEDILPPYVPQIAQVQVDTTTGHALVTWDVNQAPDTHGYIILQFTPGSGWAVIDTVYGINNTQYTAIANGASSGSETYAVAAIDDCLSGNPASYNTSPAGNQHSTVYLEGEANICSRTITLNFNAYAGWAVQSYQVYMQAGAGAYILVATLPSGTLQYTTAALTPMINYRFLVKTTGSGGRSSLSNVASVFMNEPTQPGYNYLQTATVELDGSVTLRVNADQLANLSGVRVERSLTGTPPFTTVSYVQLTANPVTLQDMFAPAADMPVYYRAVAIDSCGNESIMSNTMKTIYLQATADQLNLFTQLEWTPGSGWDGIITGYELYRVYMDGSSELIATLNASATTYQDYVGNVLDENGRFRYVVVAQESINSYGISEVSASNAVQVFYEPLVWIPNAFTPNGLNPVFKPVLGFADAQFYEFMIFNRWGERIFMTSDLNAGWDGYINGEVAQSDVYVYKIIFTASDGGSHQRHGSVTLVR